MESRSVRFAAAARVLTDAARHAGHVAPGFRSPPRVPGRMRTIRHHADGSATISLVLRDRPWAAVLADMVEGVVVVNAPDAGAAELLRDLLWSAVESLDVPDAPMTGPVASSDHRGTTLRIVDAA